ncbi:hypothetical protein FB451DRAFT_1183607 [Mycena latifolia]|nr:hypothetical protein FB451DRAFT_1183607 [Mycena latifolia]
MSLSFVLLFQEWHSLLTLKTLPLPLFIESGLSGSETLTSPFWYDTVRQSAPHLRLGLVVPPTSDALSLLSLLRIHNNTILGGAMVDGVNAFAGDRCASIPTSVGGILGTSTTSALGIGTILDELLGYGTQVQTGYS